MVVVGTGENTVHLTDIFVREKSRKLKEIGAVLDDGLLDPDEINRKIDVLAYLIHIWRLNKGNFPFISNIKLSSRRVRKIYFDFNQLTIKEIVALANIELSRDDLRFKPEKVNFTSQKSKKSSDSLSFSNKSSTVTNTNTKATEATNTFSPQQDPIILVKPRVKFLTDGIKIPKDSVTITFTSE